MAAAQLQARSTAAGSAFEVSSANSGYCLRVLLMSPPGVYRPQSDTALLAESLRLIGVAPGARVLDVGTGTGALAMAAVQAGAGHVTAIDVSRRAVLAARFNTRVRRLPVRVEHGDALARVAHRRFDMVLSNPPYVPAEGATAPRRGPERAWDAGRQGRALLDPLCRQAAGLLNPGGMLLLVHSTVAGVDVTFDQLRGAGLSVSVIARRKVGFGPVMRTRQGFLRRNGMVQPGQTHEELVVIRGDRPA
jgi:release factor glutamine methyltransferase